MPFRKLFGRRSQVRPTAPRERIVPWDPWVRLDRFLLIGTETGSCPAGERIPSSEEAKHTSSLIRTNGLEVVERIRVVSGGGRAIRTDACLYALALAASIGAPEVRQAALSSLPTVARTASQLFTFIRMSEGMRGWGRGYRRAIAAWYTQANPEDLAHQVMRSWSREGWAHRDVLRLSHPRPENDAQSAVFSWIAGRGAAGLPLIEAHEELQQATDLSRAVKLILDHRLPREAVPPSLQDHPDIWGALVEDMPYGQILKNLGNITSSGYVHPGSEGSRKICEKLTDESRLRIARLHPLAIQMAYAGYAGSRGGWKPDPALLKALEEAFESAMDLLLPMDRRVLLAIDATGSMQERTVGGTMVTPSAAAAAMAVALLRRDKGGVVMSIGSQYRPAPIKAAWGLAECQGGLPKGGAGSMDCSLPLVSAQKSRQVFDAIVVVTDSETVYRESSPTDALLRYRETVGIDARLAIVGMTSSGFSLADPEDAAMLDMIGFDADSPRALVEFLGEPDGS
jgi:60 kDa SS-A/Ro ribonucleoprotein